jgi:hypothetical protein
MLLPVAVIRAQGRPEIRADAVISKKTAIYAGAGILFPLGTYLRSGVVAAAGAADGAASFRADMVNIFHVDPFRESRWGPYGGGGISYRRDAGDKHGNAYLFAAIGAEGPVKRGYSPSIELGLGGGVRAGFVLRKSRERTR